MKRKIFLFATLAAVMLSTVSCKKALENLLSKEVTIKNRTVSIYVDPAQIADTTRKQLRSEVVAEELMYEGKLTVEVEKELKKNNLTLANLKSLRLETCTLEVTETEASYIRHFEPTKFYLGNRNHLVARSGVVDEAAGKIFLTIVNGELRPQLQNDQIPLLLTGNRPDRRVRLTMRMDLKAKVSLIK